MHRPGLRAAGLTESQKVVVSQTGIKAHLSIKAGGDKEINIACFVS